MFISRLANLHNVVEERIGNFQKLVRHTVGHDDHVAFGDLTSLPVADAASSQFIGCRGLGIDSLAPGDKGG